MCACVCVDFIYCYLYAWVFSFKRLNARIHATDLIHWIGVFCFFLSRNIHRTRQYQISIKTHKFSSEASLTLSVKRWTVSCCVICVQLDIWIETIENSMRPLWHIPNARIPHTALEKKHRLHGLMFAVCLCVYFCFRALAHISIVCRVYSLFVHPFMDLILCVCVFLMAFFVVVDVVCYRRSIKIQISSLSLDKHKLISCHFAWDSQ